MRTALSTLVLTTLVLAAPAAAVAQTHACMQEASRICRHASAAPAHRRHLARWRHAHVARYGGAYHIPRFNQGEAEAYVHTVYPYRTGLYVPWPDAYAAPYPDPYAY